MSRTFRTVTVSALVATVVVTGSIFISAPVAAANKPSKPVSSAVRFTLSDADDPTDFWTPWRIAKATPMTADRTRAPRTVASDETGGRPQVDLGTDTFDEPRVTRAAEVQPAAEYPFPYNRYTLERQLRRVPPYRQVGRIFFRQNGALYSCSGSSVTGGKRHVVFTAGHCLNDGAGTWSTDVVFIPGRQPGKKKNPYGKFAAKLLWVPEGWELNGLWAYDMGAFHVKRSTKNGKPLRKAVGALGFAYNQPRAQHFDAFGYPAAGKFSGNALIHCAAGWGADDENVSGPDSMGIGCDMTGGSSGGPWIIALRRRNLLNGVTSYGYLDQPAALYSPYFDGATANRLRCAAGTGNPDATGC